MSRLKLYIIPFKDFRRTGIRGKITDYLITILGNQREKTERNIPGATGKGKYGYALDKSPEGLGICLLGG